MHRLLRPVLVGIVVIVAAFTAAAAPAASAAIKPNQHFKGLVNGTNSTPVVYTVCAGPVSSATGPVAGGQTMSVRRVRKGHGYTGLFSQVYAWFVPTAAGSAPQMLKFTDYGVAQLIPTTIQVPCNGPGQVEFSSCPYLAPCAAGWVPDFVNVRFVNIAV